MASRRTVELALTLFVFGLVWPRATGQSNCNSVIANLSPCLNYITGNSSSPSPDCCNQLANVIKTQAECLCEVISGNAPSIGVRINQTRAFDLPGACNLQTPSINRCNVTAGSPSGAPNGTSGSPTTPSGGGSSGGCRTKMASGDDQLFTFLVIMASFLSVFAVVF